jgi:hypothetical protein
MDRSARAAAWDSIAPVIYCVVPEPMEPQLYDRLVEYYADDPNVTVIVDRRKAERRHVGERSEAADQRELRDRRRRRPGDIPPLVSGG